MPSQHSLPPRPLHSQLSRLALTPLPALHNIDCSAALTRFLTLRLSLSHAPPFFLGPGVAGSARYLPPCPRVRWDIKTVPWTDWIGDELPYVKAVQRWCTFHDTSTTLIRTRSRVTITVYVSSTMDLDVPPISSLPWKKKSLPVMTLFRLALTASIRVTRSMPHHKSSRSSMHSTRPRILPTIPLSHSTNGLHWNSPASIAWRLMYPSQAA